MITGTNAGNATFLCILLRGGSLGKNDSLMEFLFVPRNTNITDIALGLSNYLFTTNNISNNNHVARLMMTKPFDMKIHKL